MTADALAGRIPGARQRGRGWLARCPAHDDRAPSLSVSAGRDGRVLLKCFSGCGVDRIVAALGLSARDLFERDSKGGARRSERRPSSPAEIRADLLREAAAFRVRHALPDASALLPSEMNAIRQRVAMRLGVSLAPLPQALWEGSYGGRERDRLWPVAFERAWSELWFERGMEPPQSLAERAKEGRDLRPAMRILVEERAASIFADLATSASVAS